MTDTQTARERLDALIAEATLTMTATHIPSTYDPKSKEWQGIEWKIEIFRGRAKMETTYKQGIGHLPERIRPGYGGLTVDQAALIAYALRTGRYVARYPDTNALYGGQPLPKPNLSDVLGCLLSDASAADYASYEEWAADLGYDADSRKGEKIFEACRNIALDLNRIIGAAVVEKMRELANEL